MWTQIQSRISALAEVSYRDIGPLGLELVLEEPSEAEAEEVGAGA